MSAVAVTGLITYWIYLDSLATLWTTGYGRALAAKMLLFGVTGAIGAYNWKRLRAGRSRINGQVAQDRAHRIDHRGRRTRGDRSAGGVAHHEYVN